MKMNSEDIIEAILFHCPNSRACQILMQRIKTETPPFDILSCNLSSEEARKRIAGGKIDIKRVPTLMVVFSDETAEFFYGIKKIMDYISQFEIQVSQDEGEDTLPVYGENVPEEAVQDIPRKKKLEFIDTKRKEEGEGKEKVSFRSRAEPGQGKEKYKDTIQLAKKMEQEMQQTYGYNNQKSV